MGRSGYDTTGFQDQVDIDDTDTPQSIQTVRTPEEIAADHPLHHLQDSFLEAVMAAYSNQTDDAYSFPDEEQEAVSPACSGPIEEEDGDVAGSFEPAEWGPAASNYKHAAQPPPPQYNSADPSNRPRKKRGRGTDSASTALTTTTTVAGASSSSGGSSSSSRRKPATQKAQHGQQRRRNQDGRLCFACPYAKKDDTSTMGTRASEEAKKRDSSHPLTRSLEIPKPHRKQQQHAGSSGWGTFAAYAPDNNTTQEWNVVKFDKDTEPSADDGLREPIHDTSQGPTTLMTIPEYIQPGYAETIFPRPGELPDFFSFDSGMPDFHWNPPP